MALVKETMYVEFKGSQVNQKDLFNSAKQEWKNAGNKVKDLITTDIYFQPEENKCYYVLNRDLETEIKGFFEV